MTPARSAFQSGTPKSVNRKRLLPQIGYDEESVSNNASKFGCENTENSVSMFQGLLTDPTIPSKLSKSARKSFKRHKPDHNNDEDIYFDDEAANDGLASFNDFDDSQRDAKNASKTDFGEVEILKECNVENNIESGNEFWKRPVRGKKFTAKGKTIVASAILANFEKPSVKKTWIADGFNEWLKYLQTKWRFNLYEKREKNKEANLATSTNGQLFNRYQNSSSKRWNSNYGSVLNIIQITETKMSGQFTVFALGDDGMRRFNLVVPRMFYIDDIYERSTDNCRCVQKTLPKMRPSYNLYEFSVDESHFASRLNDFNCEMCSMRINGIYETQVPLMFKAIVELGITCRLDSVKNSLNVSLEQLHTIKSNDVLYPELTAFRTMFFYEFSHLNRSVIAFFSPSTAQGFIFIINRARVDVSNVETLYKTEFRKFIERRGKGILDEKHLQLSVQIIQTTSVKDGSQRLHNVIKAMKLLPTEPVLICIQSLRNASSISKDFKFLNEFPQIRINVSEPASLMNVLDWANMMAKRSIQHFFNSFVYLKDYWVMAQYSLIPVGNIVDDSPMIALDIMYARQLKQKNYLLWASPSSRPDFGGKDLEDWRLGNGWETASFRHNSGFIYSKESFEVKNIVVELGLGAVAVTALLQSFRIAEAEGTSESVSFAATGTSTMSIECAMLHRLALTNYDEGIAASGALSILKEIFHDLVRDIHLYENAFADQLVISMHRWIRNPNALMYNPAICSAVSTLMRKLCLLLVAEINRLGGSVIHCSFTKIVLSTNRSNILAANGFVESLVDSLGKKAIFASLHINVLQYSKLFMWIDPTNYALVKCNKDHTHLEVQEGAQVRLHFLMSKCLPEEGGCLKVFKSIIAGYLVRLSEKLSDQVSDDEFEKFCNDILEEEITPTLFKLTTKFVEVRHQLKISEKNRPIYFIDVEDFDIPLEFVKCICKILSINPYIARKVDSVRSQLMLILQLDDAAPSTFWTAPPVNVVLEYVYCKECNQSADLNINTGTAEEADGTVVFVCSVCRTKLLTSLIEEMLIERASKILQSFLLQDYKCLKCNKVAMHYLAKYCECSNNYTNSVSVDDFQLNLKVILKVAKRHSLLNLQTMLEEILNYHE